MKFNPAPFIALLNQAYVSMLESLRVSDNFRVSDNSSSSFGFFDLVVNHHEGILVKLITHAILV